MISWRESVSRLKLFKSSKTRHCETPPTSIEVPHVGMTTLTVGAEAAVNVYCALPNALGLTPVSRYARCLSCE
jgi:hypothetical protein